MPLSSALSAVYMPQGLAPCNAMCAEGIRGAHLVADNACSPNSNDLVRCPSTHQVAVERLRGELQRRLAAEGRQAPHLCSVTLDWWLWEEGERNIQRHRPHHRTLTIHY